MIKDLVKKNYQKNATAKIHFDLRDKEFNLIPWAVKESTWKSKVKIAKQSNHSTQAEGNVTKVDWTISFQFPEQNYHNYHYHGFLQNFKWAVVALYVASLFVLDM